jgi:outer membrane lipoprotein
VVAVGPLVGERVQWGGVLVETRHLEESTELEVIGYPLDGCGRPLIGSAPTGRFIIVRPGFLETTDYRSGRRVTARGRITGVGQGRVGEVQPDLPRMESYKVHLWPETVPGDYPRPWITIGVGGGSGGGVYGGVGGGVGVLF